MDLFQISEPDLRFMAGIGATGFLNGWVEGIGSYLPELVSKSSVFPDLISDELRADLSFTWRQRMRAVTAADLGLWQIVRAPFGAGGQMRPAALVRDRVHSEFIRRHASLFGYSPNGQIENPLCLKHPEVRDFYREVYRQWARSTPNFKGLILWPGDSMMDICRCEKCMANPDGLGGTYADFMSLIIEACRSVRPDTEAYLIHWHCLVNDHQPVERLMELLPARVGLVIPKTGHLLTTGEEKDRQRLNQPFLLKRGFSEGSRHLIETADKMGCPYLFFDSFCAGEDTNPVPFFPAPATIVKKVLEIPAEAPRVSGVIDFWGIDPRRWEANEIALQESLWRRPTETGAAILRHTARRCFPCLKKTRLTAVRNAWEQLDAAMQAKWEVAEFGQRLENCFVIWHDETFPPCPPTHKEAGFSMPPIAGDLVEKLGVAPRYLRLEKKLQQLRRGSAADFLRQQQGAAARALEQTRSAIAGIRRDFSGKFTSLHLDFLRLATVHFLTFSRGFEAKILIDRARAGRLKQDKAITQLTGLARSELDNWQWVRDWITAHGFDEAYWPNELVRRLQIQAHWAQPAAWRDFFEKL